MKLVLDRQQGPDALPASAGLLQRVKRSGAESGLKGFLTAGLSCKVQV